MKAEDIILPGITGTTFMTIFSQVVGEIEDENFSEPDLLAKLYHRLQPAKSNSTAKIVGWVGHYAVGGLFAGIYNVLWSNKLVKASGKNGVWLGAVSGALAIAVWKTTFKMHPVPPGIDFKKYYTQLFFAHIVFALFATAAYQQLKKQRLKNQKQQDDQKYLSSVNP
jgi:hypothetical protein